MATEWIESIASELRAQDYIHAEQYNASKRRKKLIADKSLLFFRETVQVLQSNLHDLLGVLEGTPLEQPTTIRLKGADNLEISREAIPSISASLSREADGIAFGYHVDGPTGVEEKYFFNVDENGEMSVADPFGLDLHLDTPDEVAKRVLTTLFGDR